MACGIDSVSNGIIFRHTSEFVACDVCSEVQAATNHCDECLVNLCEGCALSHKGRREQKGRHHVEPGVCNYDMEIELCPEDGQKMSFFCSSCRVRVCPECELTRKCHVMHQVVPLDQYLGQEKEKLLERLDDITSKIGTVDYIPDDIKTMAIQIELKWLERKEMMRQEFTSLLEAITTRQKKLMAEMEEEVKKSLNELEELQQSHEAILSSSCQLSDDCILAVQNLPREDFLKSYPQFLKSAQELEDQVAKMSSPVDCMPAFLQLPFSLYNEKAHLDNKLQLHTYDCQRLKAWEHMCFVPFDCLKKEMTIDMLVDAPQHKVDIPTSSVLHYDVRIYHGGRRNKLNPVWKFWKLLKATDVVINGCLGFRLTPRSLYTVKVQPVITVRTHQGNKTVRGKDVSIAVVTEGMGIENSTDYPMVACNGQTDSNNNHRIRNLNLFKNRRLSRHNSHVQSRHHDDLLFKHSVNNSRYKLDVSWSEKDYKHPVPVPVPDKGNIQCQERFALGMCSFEEARLIDNVQSKV